MYAGLSGEKSTLQAQLNVRTHLKGRFPKRPWIDVISKGDIDIPESTIQLLPQEHLSVSVKTGKNVLELRGKIEDMLLRLQTVLEERRQQETLLSSQKTVAHRLG